MTLCKYVDFMSKTTTRVHTHIHTHAHSLISFPFCNDVDVIGVNLMPFRQALFSPFFSFLFFCWLYRFVEHLRTVSVFCVSKCSDTFFVFVVFFFFFMRILIYSLLFRALTLMCSLVRTLADFLVSMQILSKFAVNYVLCIFTSKKWEYLLLGFFFFFFFLYFSTFTWSEAYTICFVYSWYCCCIRIIELALDTKVVTFRNFTT